jgi:hypothetical protein
MAPSIAYEEDFVAWSLDHAERLRALADSGADLPHLAEEIGDLRSSRAALVL